jgi:hypothetical protein
MGILTAHRPTYGTARAFSSLAAAGSHFVMLAESQILKPVRELGLLVDQARGGARGAAGEKRGGESRSKNERCKFHGVFPFVK